jgi:type I restriction enzyme S subunit
MAELDTIDIESRHLKMVKSAFARYLPYKQVWAYGSRVKWTASHASDLDCVVFGATDSEIANAKEAFDESDIPFEVQLLNWETIPDDFKKNIKEGYFVLRNKGDWGETTLGEIVDISSSKRIFYKEYVGEGVPFYRSKEIIEKHNKDKVSTDLYISEERYEEIKSKFGVPIQGDILLTSVGTLGIPYIVQEKEKFYFKDGNLTWLKNIKSNSTSDFLYYWIVSPIGKNTLNSITIGSTQPAFTISCLKEANISLPTLPEQKAIAAVLSSLDDKIDLLHRQNKTLESIAETIFRQWFVEEADERWEGGVLGDICNITGGYAFKSKDFIENGVPVIKIKNISNNRVDLLDKQFVSQDFALNIQKKFRLINGDIVMAMTGATIGKIGIVNSFDYDFLLLNQRVAVIRGKYQALLWFLLNIINLEDDIINESNGAAQANISADGIASIKIPKIYKILAQEFNLIAEPIFNKILSNQNQIKTLESLRNTLLPKLMSGDIRVKYEVIA